MKKSVDYMVMQLKDKPQALVYGMAIMSSLLLLSCIPKDFIQPQKYTHFENPPDTFRILADGQSNMLTPNFKGRSENSADRRIYIFNHCDPGWEIADLDGSIHGQTNVNCKSYKHTGHNSLTVVFAKKYLEQYPNSIVQIINTADAGIPIAAWLGKKSVQFKELKDAYKHSGMSGIDVILWHQGETDAEKGNPNYKKHFQMLLDQLDNEIAAGIQKPMIIGHLLSHKEKYAQFNSENIDPLEKQHGHRLRIARLEGYDVRFLQSPDKVHFSNGAIDTLGLAYYQTYMSLKRDMKTAENNSDE
jgi:hypothetical protein